MSLRIDLAKLSLMEALDLAVLIEYEAYERYNMFAAQHGHQFPGDATSIFSTMADNESKHGEALAERRKALFGDVPVSVSLDDLFDVEAPEMGAPRFNMSPLQAMEIALASEQKAFDFFDQALTKISDPDIKELFTELRDEEAEHVRMAKEIIASLPPEAGAVREKDEDEFPAM